MKADNFRLWRKRRALSRREAAHLFKVSVETIKSWETGRRKVSMPYVLELACRHLDAIDNRHKPID